MPHQRELIRKAVRQALEDAVTVADTRVFATRILPLRKIQLPAIAVYTLEDDVSADSKLTGPRELERDLRVTVEGWVNATEETVDDLMDALSLEIETAMHADPTFGAMASDSILSGTDLEVVETGDRLMGVVILTYSTKYFTLAPEPSEILDDFETVNAEYNPGGTTDPGDIAIDDFAVEAP